MEYDWLFGEDLRNNIWILRREEPKTGRVIYRARYAQRRICPRCHKLDDEEAAVRSGLDDDCAFARSTISCKRTTALPA